MSSASAGLIVVAVAVVWLVGSIAAVRAVKRRAELIEHSAAAVSDKVHRLQRLALMTVAWMFAGYLVFGLAGGVTAAMVHHSRSHHHAAAAVVLVVVLVLIALIVVPYVLMFRTVRAALVRVRDISTKLPNRRRRVIAGVSLGLCYAAIIIAGRLLAPGHGTGRVIGLMVTYLVALLLLMTVLVPVVMVRLVTSPMAETTASPLRQLAEKMGVRVHGFRTMSTRGQKVANAMQVGTVPGLRYVVLTDYLTDHLPPDELAAVVAHELAHARRHHLLRKLGVVFGTWIAAEALLIGVGHAAGASTVVKALIIPLAVLLPISIIVMQGVFGVRFEQEADDIAAGCVGRAELAAALQCVGQLNDTKRDTGRAWSILTQHPGLQQRLDRLTQETPSRQPAHTAR